MQVIWRRSPICAAEIVAELAGPTGWNHRTVRTLLNRLVRKGALDFDTIANRYLYRPKVSRDACVRAESRSFVRKVFCGDTGSLVLHFVRNGRLSAADLSDLRKALEDKREEQDQ
jgi:BlaI family penicillinase repressor